MNKSSKSLLISAAVSAFIGSATIATATHKEHCMKGNEEVAGVADKAACDALGEGHAWVKAEHGKKGKKCGGEKCGASKKKH